MAHNQRTFSASRTDLKKHIDIVFFLGKFNKA